MAFTDIVSAQKNQSELASYLAAEAVAGRVLLPSGLGLQQQYTRGFSVSSDPNASATAKLFTVFTAQQDGKYPEDVSVHTNVLAADISSTVATELTAGRHLVGSLAGQTLFGQSNYTLVFYKFRDTGSDTVLHYALSAADLDPAVTVSDFFPAGWLLRQAFLVVRTAEATAAIPTLYVQMGGTSVIGANDSQENVGVNGNVVLTGTVQEPFNIQAGVNDDLSFDVENDQDPNTAVQSVAVELSAGATQTAQNIADDINAQLVIDGLDSVIEASAVGGYVVLECSNAVLYNRIDITDPGPTTGWADIGFDGFVGNSFRGVSSSVPRIIYPGTPAYSYNPLFADSDLVITGAGSDFAELAADLYFYGCQLPLLEVG